MTFQKPSTITSSPVGSAYTFKSPLPSPPQNYIDQSLPHCVDGYNGGTYPGNITLSGVTTITGTQVLDSTSTTSCVTGSNLTGHLALASATIIATGSTSLSMHSGTSVLLQAGSDMTFGSGSVLGLQGAGTVLSDNNAPQYAAPLTRSIVQPLIINSINNSIQTEYTLYYPAASNGGYFNDFSGSLIFTYPMTKLINGATLSSFTFTIVTNTAPTTAFPTIKLYSQAMNTVTTSNVLITAPSPIGYNILASFGGGSFNGLINGTQYVCTVPVSGAGTAPVDDSIYNYFIQIQAGNQGTSPNYSIDWFPIQLNFTNHAGTQSSLNSTVSI